MTHPATFDARLTVLKQWVHIHVSDLSDGINHANPYVSQFLHTLTDAQVLQTPEAIEAAEIALMELDADWEGK